nr:MULTISPECIES: CesT family type III secretion system chaperone [unclassified Pseudomonas]
MPSAAYCRLVDDLCQLALLPNPKALYERTALTVGKVNFSLVERSGDPYSEVLIYTDLGPLPSQHRDAVLLRLLDINFHLFVGAGSPSCSYNSETQRLTLGVSLLLQAATGQRLLALLGQLADMAHNWRGDHFLERPSPRHAQVRL